MSQFKQLHANNFTRTGWRDGGIMYHPIKGVGATPNHQDVLYFGFVTMMKPTSFLQLARRLTTAEFSQETISHLSKPDTLFAPAFLRVKIKGNNIKVEGHEGRHRCAYLHQALKGKPVPVYIHCGDLRAREIDQDWFSVLPNMDMFSESGGVRVKTPILAAYHETHGFVE